ncbi:probable proline--tRNA ligase, mitochondrial [Condylostylus longicornis]|uniref:probable proline--tRNA ligase, mitochondrial n=1 Tax=Condylostylus longicornis TaxID=2530218 RepID=UPI00244E4DE4|nr:probable proline--tRNA ligase, mitochondrial [Condylostylus longicornis]
MYHKLSKIFWPRSVIPKDAINIKAQGILSKSQKLMLDLGLIKPIGNGTYQITPIAQRSLDKCVSLVTKHMDKIEGQKMSLSLLTPADLWQKSGRLSNTSELFLFTEPLSNKPLHLLSPTHEESVTNLLSQSQPISYKQLPILLYQIGWKFRDELKPRFGMIRAKEFLMKDLYSFDKSIEDAKNTYDIVTSQYNRIFDSLQLPWVKIEADSGIMGGQLSHEYHILSDIGEDNIINCRNCGFCANEELYKNSKNNCIKCNSSQLSISKGIEIGHTFFLNEKYSTPLKANFLNVTGKTEPLIMGCYGIGITRLIAASLEVLSNETELRWPILLSPYDVCVIPPKEGSKEAEFVNIHLKSIMSDIVHVCGEDSVLVDDRTNLTIGKRLLDAKKMGYPNIIIIGSKYVSDDQKIEIFQTKENKSELLEIKDILMLLKEYKNEKNNLFSYI